MAHLIQALGRQRQVHLSEFKASLVNRVSSRPSRAGTQRNTVLKSKNQNKAKMTVVSICAEKA